MLGAEPGGAFVQQGEVQRIGQPGKLAEAELLCLQFPEQRLGQREDRIGQRIGIDARGFLAEEVLCPIRNAGIATLSKRN
jgi:hypothetical protein